VSGEPAPSDRPADPSGRPLHWGVRVVLLVVGWVLILVGIAGLILPGIQGIATILAGLAILSLASEIAHRILRRLLRRWPRAWQRVESFREKSFTKLERFVRR